MTIHSPNFLHPSLLTGDERYVSLRISHTISCQLNRVRFIWFRPLWAKPLKCGEKGGLRMVPFQC